MTLIKLQCNFITVVTKLQSNMIKEQIFSAREGDLKNLLKFKAEYPNNVSHLILLYNGPFQCHESIIFLPFWLI
jgi:hypothetical protein